MKTLTSWERIKRTLDFKDIDRVATGAVFQNSDLISKFAGREVHNDYTYEEVINTFKGLEVDLAFLVGGAEKPGTVESLKLKWRVQYWTRWVEERPFKDVEGLKEYAKWMISEIKKSDPLSMWNFAGYGAAFGQKLTNYNDYLIDLKERLGGSVPCQIESPVGMDAMYNTAGFELFTYLYADDPGLVSEWYDTLNEHEINRINLEGSKNKLADLSPIVCVYCDIAGKDGLLFSPEFLRKEHFPRTKKLVDTWHEHSIKVFYHSDGDLKSILGDLVNCGIDGIHPLEKNNTPLEYVREHYPNLFMFGGIDQAGLLINGTPEEVEIEVKKAIDVCKDGGYILCCDGGFTENCKVENILKLFEVAKNYKP